MPGFSSAICKTSSFAGSGVSKPWPIRVCALVYLAGALILNNKGLANGNIAINLIVIRLACPKMAKQLTLSVKIQAANCKQKED